MPIPNRLYVNFKVQDLMITMSHDKYESEDCPMAHSLDDCSPCTNESNCAEDSNVSERYFLDPGDLRAMSTVLTKAMLPVMETKETILPQSREGLEILEKKVQLVLRAIQSEKAKVR